MFNRKEQSPEEKHYALLLRYTDLRALIKGLKPSLPETHAAALEEILQEAEVIEDDADSLEEIIKKLELSISAIEYFLLSFRDTITANRRPAITRVLESSQNHIIAAAAMGTDPKK